MRGLTAKEIQELIAHEFPGTLVYLKNQAVSEDQSVLYSIIHVKSKNNKRKLKDFIERLSIPWEVKVEVV